jgi:hypothetical protein
LRLNNGVFLFKKLHKKERMLRYIGRHANPTPEKSEAKVLRGNPLYWLFPFLFFLFFLGSCIYLLVYSQSALVVTRLGDDESDLLALVDQFARTVSRQDWQGNTELFVQSGGGSTIDFHRAFQFLTDNPIASANYDLAVETASIGSWGQQMAVFAGGLSSNHLLIGNCNITIKNGGIVGSMDCIAIYSYTFAYSMSLFTNNYATQFVVFQPRFEASKTPTPQGWLFTKATALINATSTLLSSIETGSAPPGAVITKKRGEVSKRSLIDVWATLLSQIDILILGGQIDTAKAVCKTQQYSDLAATFDPYGNDTALQCNTIMRAPVVFDSPITCGVDGGINVTTCLPPDFGGIETINSIVPLPITDDFTITGGFGISIAGGMHGITIHNTGLTSIPLIGTPELDFLIIPFPVPTLQVVKLNQSANTVWAGPVSGPPDESGFRLLVLDDIPLIDLSNHVINTLSLSNGGTNNAGPYAGGRIIISNVGGTQLVESPLLMDGFFLVADAGGALIPGTLVAGAGINVSFVGGTYTITALESLTVVQVDLSVPTDIFQVTSVPIIDNGTLTFVVLPQAAHAVWIGPNSGGPVVPSFRVLEEVDMPVISLTGSKLSGILPTSRGGTNNDGSTWVGERVIMSDTGGSSLTEATVTGVNGVSITLGVGPSLIISGTGNTCTNTTIDQSCLDISTLSCPGGSLGASCIPSALTLSALTVTGPSSLGTSTTCASPLSAPCYDISSQSCPGGYLNLNCINPDLVLNSLMVNTITANDIMLLNGTVTVTGVSTFDVINTTVLYAAEIHLSGPMMCSPEDTISQDCYDISSISCTSPISSNCFPINITVADLSVTNDLEVNNVACLGFPLGNDCIPSRVRTINGINPTLAPALDFTISAGTGVSITPDTNGITVSNTGVTSVGLSLPTSVFSITVPSVVTTGTLTAVFQNQLANTFFASPDGVGGTPSFRGIEFSDLPNSGSPNSIYYVDGAGNLTTAALSLSLSVPSAEFSVAGSPITNPTGSFVITKQTQAANTIWMGPLSGGAATPAFRTLSLVDFSPLGLTNGQVLTGVTAGAPVGKTLVASTNMIITELSGSFVFESTSVDAISNITVTVPSYLSVTPATLTSSGTFAITSNTQSANRFLGGPTSGGAATPDFRAMVNADLPPLADGQLYIGVTGGAPVSSQLTAGSLITITPGPGTSTVSTTALGTVTLNMPTAVFDVASVSGVNSQTLSVSFDTQAPNTFFAGPSSGGAATPTFRAITTADLPTAILLSYSEATSATNILAFSTGAYTTVTSMTVTPVAGTYWCSFSTTVIPSTSSGVYDVALHLNGVIIPHSLRTATGSSSYFNIHTLAVIVTPGSQVIDVRWQKSGGSGTAEMRARSLYCLRIN